MIDTNNENCICIAPLNQPSALLNCDQAGYAGVGYALDRPLGLMFSGKILGKQVALQMAAGPFGAVFAIG